MAFFVAGAAALGFAGLGFYVNPGRAQAEELANSMFSKPYSECSPSEKTAVDMAHGIPKLERLRDGFHSLFPKPKSKVPKMKSKKTFDADEQLSDGPERSGQQQEEKPYALYDDPDVLAVYPVHEDTADPDQRYLADFKDLKNLVPFDIETESLEDAGTYDVEEYLKEHDRYPQTFTLPRQLGGAATSANLLVNKLSKGTRAGISENYILPGHGPLDHVHPPTEEELEAPPREAVENLRDSVDYKLGAGKYQRGIPDDVQRALDMQERLRQRREAEEAVDEDEDEDEDYSDDDEDYSDEESESEEVVAVRPAATGRQAGGRGKGAVQQTRAPQRVETDSEEYDDEDEDSED